MATKASRKIVTNPFYDAPPTRRKVTNPYFGRVRKGRPKRAEGQKTTQTKSIRLPPETWTKLKEQASREGKTLHAALRQAALLWLRS